MPDSHPVTDPVGNGPLANFGTCAIGLWPALILAGLMAGCGRSATSAAKPDSVSAQSRDATKSEAASPPLPPSNPETTPVLWHIELRLSSEAYRELEPVRGGLGWGGGGLARSTASPPHTAEARARGERPQPVVGFFNFGEDSGAGTFGFDFTTVKADAQIGDVLIRDVGLRYKGNGSYQTARSTRKRSFKLEFDHYVPDQRFEGRTRLNLNCNSLDPTQLRDALGYRLFAEAGLPAPQTRFAEVSVKVGNDAPELLGLYTLVEQVDRKFLRQHLGSTSGLLLKPEGIKGIPWFGTEIYRYEQPYNAKWRGTDRQWERVIEFAHLVNRTEDDEFEETIESFLDVDRFLRFLACQVLLANLDSFLGSGHNYYLYLDDETNRFVFLPWDLDLSFGGFFLAGSVEDLAELSLEHPHQGENRLIDRLLRNPARREAYKVHLRGLVSRVFHPGGLGTLAAEWERFAEPMREREAAAWSARGESTEGGFGMWGRSGMRPSEFIKLREASVLSQLEGAAEGFVPSSGWGRGRGRGR
ncbi:MAG: CotH kinase family protein [Planctomycetaceae bacterium]